MSARPFDSLVSALSSLDVPCESTRSVTFAETLSEHVQGPAVGTPLDGVDACLSESDVTVDPTPAELKAARTGVTPASFAIADYGSVVVPSTSTGVELVSLFVDRHVVVLDNADILPGMEAAFNRFGKDFRTELESAVIATGPSVTADMGGLVHGAHGPSEVRVVIVEETDD